MTGIETCVNQQTSVTNLKRSESKRLGSEIKGTDGMKKEDDNSM